MIKSGEKQKKNSQKLFEMLCLEGQQAGLSWYTFLKKRVGYRDCFYHFNPTKIAKMTQQDVDRLMQEPRIVRNRLKINAIITNAQAYLAMIQAGEDFSQFVWQFVDGKHKSTIGNIRVKYLLIPIFLIIFRLL